MGKTQLAPGFRFSPIDVELVRYYLKRKVMGKKLIVDAIAEVDIYKFEPPDLPDKSYIRSGDLKWHFFCPREKKYATGVRANRATECGYWKTTGKDRAVMCNAEVVGKIKTLVYHFGKSPRGQRTDWVMHEYSLEDKALTQMNVPQDTYVVCVIFKKDGPGPRNGAQYGAPFKEEDWNDVEEHTEVRGPNRETSFGGMISESCVSDFLPATTTRTEQPSFAANSPLPAVPLLDCYNTTSLAVIPIAEIPLAEITLAETPRAPNNFDDINAMLDLFVVEDEYLRLTGPNNNEVRHDTGVSAPVCVGEEGIFSGLEDLNNVHETRMTPNSVIHIELQDLSAPVTVNLNDWRSSYLIHQDNFDLSTVANDDPYSFCGLMGHGPDM